MESEAITRVAFGGMLTGLGAAGLGLLGGANVASAEEEAWQEYASPDGSFALRYPASFQGFAKPLKTHRVEAS